MTRRIAMWSGPRNLSTALMYAFAARGDCAVTDEPYYAAFLALSGADHPMRDAVLASQPNDPTRVILDGPAPGGARLWYQKHMTHHLLAPMPRGWMSGCTHAYLIRHPARVIASYARKREAPALADLGYAQQRALHAANPGPILDSTELRAAPETMLRALCAALRIDWSDRMLHWPAGPKPFDGIWAAHWYNAVHQSRGLDGAEAPLPDLPPAYAHLARQAMPDYLALAQHRLRL